MKDNNWTTIIKPKGNRLNIDLGAVWGYKDLILMLFLRDFTALYKQTVLGPAWYLIQPLLTSATYYVIFGRIANVSTDGIHPFLFYMSGVIYWNLFSACLINNAEVFSKNANLFGKVYFPRLVVPISVAMSAIVAYAIQLFLFCVMYSLLNQGAHGITEILSLLFISPLMAAYVAILGVSIGLIVSALTVRFRDLAFAIGFVVQLWMYATPVVYPLSMVPAQYSVFFELNPMVAPIEVMRHYIFDAPMIRLDLIVKNFLVVLILMVSGLAAFTKAESDAIDTV